jgi:hypothetical protein
MAQSSADDLTQVMGIGSLGEVRPGPDGNLYQWVQGIDGLGNPVGFWKFLKRVRRGIHRGIRQVTPLVQQVAPFIPALAPAAAALRFATPLLRQAGVAGDGLGAVYQTPAGQLYQIQGLEADDDLQGFEGDDDLQGLEADDELQGLEGDDDLQGLGADEDLQGLEGDEDLQGLEAADDLQGLEGYVREAGSQLGAYTPQQPARTRWFTPPAQPPEMWRPMW